MKDEKQIEDEYAIDESALRCGCDLWFAVPAGFSEVLFGNLLADSSSSEGRRVIATVRALLELAPESRQEELLRHLRSVPDFIGAMIDEGVVHVSIGAHEDEDGKLLQSFLTVASRDVPFAPPKLTAVRAATMRNSAVPIALADMPCGPVAFVEALIDLPASVDARQHSLYEVTAYLPHPSGRKLSVLTLTTPAVQARDHYREIHRHIAETVSFENPLPEDIKAQIPESEVAASVRAVFG